MRPTPLECLIAFGSNQGDRQGVFENVLGALTEIEGVIDVQASSIWETTPIGGPGNQNKFINAIIKFFATCDAHDLLQRLNELEKRLGRVRNVRWESRKVDLDILLFADQVIQTDDLQIPHPRMSFRRFVLEPAVEIAADMVHPVSGKSIQQLLDHLNCKRNVIALVDVDDRFAELLIQNTSHSIELIRPTTANLVTSTSVRKPPGSPAIASSTPAKPLETWQVVQPMNLAEYDLVKDSAKLMVGLLPQTVDSSIQSERTELLERAKSFAGPALFLVPHANNLESVVEEVDAALDAMTSI